AERVYREALQIDDKNAKFQAHNNLGVLYDRQGKTGDALKLFKETKLDIDLPAPQKANFLYNFGHALEKDQPDEAYRKYQQALQLNRNHQAAAEGAFRVLLNPANTGPDPKSDQRVTEA